MPVITRPFLPVREPIVRARTGLITPLWQRWAQGVQGAMDSISRFRGAVWGTLAQQPTTLGRADEGLLYMVTDFGHVCRWSGSVWEFAPGDEGNGFLKDCPVAPQMASWWALCNGGATSYLVVGGVTLTTLPFTTPNLQSGAYRKGGSYTGSVLAAAAPGASASLSGNTAVGTTEGPSNVQNVQTWSSGDPTEVARFDHYHAHTHPPGSLAVDVSVDANAEPSRLVCPVYFRR